MEPFAAPPYSALRDVVASGGCYDSTGACRRFTEASVASNETMAGVLSHRVHDVVAVAKALTLPQACLVRQDGTFNTDADPDREFFPPAIVKECGSGKTTLGKLLLPALAE